MSAEIKSAYWPERESVDFGPLGGTYDPPRMFLRATSGSSSTLTNLNIPDFLAAVEKECDGIFVRRADLPEVQVINREIRVGGSYRTLDKEYSTYAAMTARENGLKLLALAEYLDAHPPIDEAQVTALSDVLSNVGDGGVFEYLDRTNSDILARALVRAGVRAPEVTP